LPETNAHFRANLIEALGSRIKHGQALIDAVLYENVCLLDPTQAQDTLSQILGKRVPPLEGTFFGSFDLYSRAKMAKTSVDGNRDLSGRLDQKIAEK